MDMLRPVYLPILTTLLFSTLVLANGAEYLSKNNEPLWLRNTALSPDGKYLAFTYQSKIFLVDSTGGSATPITNGDFYPHHLVWSSDNKTLAFAAQPYGHDDVFTLEIGTNQITRHTYNSWDDIPASFTNNGQGLLFNTSRVTSHRQDFYNLSRLHFSQLYHIDLKSQRAAVAMTLPAKNAMWNQSTSQLLYNSPHKDQAYRKHQQSFAVPNIWLFDKATNTHTRLTNERIAAEKPVWNSEQNGFFYLSEQSGDFNVWFYDLATSQTKQLTFLKGHPVRDLTADNENNLSFSYKGELYRLNNGAKSPEKIAIQINNFSPKEQNYWYSRLASDFVPSEQNVEEVLLTSYGDLYAFNTKKSQFKAITQTITEEKDVSYTPDGYGSVYSALRNGFWGIYQSYSTIDKELLSSSIIREESPLLISDKHNLTQPQFSPDGTKLAFVVDGKALHIIHFGSSDKHQSEAESEKNNVVQQQVNQQENDMMVTVEPPASQEEAQIEPDIWSGELSDLGKELISAESYIQGIELAFAWSPDSNQLAVNFLTSPHLFQIRVVDVNGNIAHVSENGFDNFAPEWSKDGNILFWQTTQSGERSSDGFAVNATLTGVFVSNIAKQDFQDSLGLEQTEHDESDNPLPQPKYIFNQNSIEYRKAFQLPSSGNYIDAHLSGDDLLVIEETKTPSGEYTTKAFIYNIRTGESHPLFHGYPIAKETYITEDQSYIYLLTDDDIIEISADSGDASYFALNIPINFDRTSRRKAAFDELILQTQEQFYRPDMNGVDWNELSKQYAKFLPHINNDIDLTILLKELAGELNVSHTNADHFVWNQKHTDESAVLGLILNEHVLSEKNNARPLVIAEILPGGPFDREDTKIKPGDRIVAIDGKAVSNLAQLSQALNHKVDEKVIVGFENNSQESWQKKVTAISLQHQADLIDKRWQVLRRDYVLEKSDGKVGYVYLSDMNLANFEHLFAEALGRLKNTEVLILDIRFNRGGWLANTLIQFLTTREVAVLAPSKGKPSSEASSMGWVKPSVTLINAWSYSDASVFGQYYMDLNVGPIIGEPVPGTGTAVKYIQPHTYPDIIYSFPYLPVKKSSGEYYENLELIPDVKVLSHPEDIANGIDTQLDSAIEVALSQVK